MPHGHANCKYLLSVKNFATDSQTYMEHKLCIVHQTAQHLDWDIVECIKGSYRQQLVLKAVLSYMDSGIDIEPKSFCKHIHFTLVAWQHCTQRTIENCFHQCGCGCGCEVNTEADLGAGNELRTGIS